MSFEKFKTPEAQKLAILGGVTIATSVAFSILPKGVSIAVLTMAAAVITVKALDKNYSAV